MSDRVKTALLIAAVIILVCIAGINGFRPVAAQVAVHPDKLQG